MTFATVTNIATMILCIAVLVQAVRLMRALETVRGGALSEMIAALDVSTLEARRVLARLTELMRGDVATTTRTLVEGKAMVEELAIMTGIANAVAERIVDAAGAANAPRIAARSEPPAAAAAADTVAAAPPTPAAPPRPARRTRERARANAASAA